MNPNVLVAGCGTGKQTILAAKSYLNAKVVGVDLSLSSLSYAKRKSEELGITNIDYLQADLFNYTMMKSTWTNNITCPAEADIITAFKAGITIIKSKINV